MRLPSVSPGVHRKNVPVPETKFIDSTEEFEMEDSLGTRLPKVVSDVNSIVNFR